MKLLLLTLIACVSLSMAQSKTIDLEKYKNNKNYKVAETPYTIGKHTFLLVNIKPVIKSDTACISAIVIDKRKYVLFDIGVEGAATGLIVPAVQPVHDGLVVIKASAQEGKTFVFLSNGKLVTLPGSLVIPDTTGGNLYLVWENDPQYRLTVFDYKNIRVRVPTTVIAKPVKWYSSGLSFYFTADKEKGYYTIEMFTKSITGTEKPDGTLTPVSYLVDFGKIDASKCCGGNFLKK